MSFDNWWLQIWIFVLPFVGWSKKWIFCCYKLLNPEHWMQLYFWHLLTRPTITHKSAGDLNLQMSVRSLTWCHPIQWFEERKLRKEGSLDGCKLEHPKPQRLFMEHNSFPLHGMFGSQHKPKFIYVPLNGSLKGQIANMLSLHRGNKLWHALAWWALGFELSY